MRVRFTAAGLLAALALTACEGGTMTEEIATLGRTQDGAAATTAAEPEVSMEEGLIAFSECLREQGVQVGDPIVGADGNLQMPPIEMNGSVEGDGGRDAMFAEMDAIFAECEPLLGEVVFTGDHLPEFDDVEDLLLEYADCMRDNGVDMPDPDFSSDGGVVIELAIGDPTDPAFVAADEACRDVLAGFGPGSVTDIAGD